MKSSIVQNQFLNQVCLCYDGLLPEEAHKLIDAITDDSMVEMMCDNDYEPELTYAVTGYRMENGKKRYSRELCLFINTVEAVEGLDITIEQQMAEDRANLEELRTIIKEKTGID